MFVKSNNPPAKDWFTEPYNSDAMSSQFIGIICNDPAVDFMLCRYSNLFIEDPPNLDGGYSHHDGLTRARGR